MFLNGLFRKKLSISEGEKLLKDYCNVNGFDFNNQWKTTTHNRNLFAYRIRSHKKISNNWVSYHLIRENDKYSIWIDLVTEEIRVVSKRTA